LNGSCTAGTRDTPATRHDTTRHDRLRRQRVIVPTRTQGREAAKVAVGWRRFQPRPIEFPMDRPVRILTAALTTALTAALTLTAGAAAAAHTGQGHGSLTLAEGLRHALVEPDHLLLLAFGFGGATLLAPRLLAALQRLRSWRTGR